MAFNPPKISNLTYEDKKNEEEESITEEIEPLFKFNTLYFHLPEGLVSVKDIKPEVFLEEMNKLNSYFSWLKPKDVATVNAREALFDMYILILSKMKLSVKDDKLFK